MKEQNTIQLDELYQYLKRFHLSDSLYVLGTINATLMAGHRKLNQQAVPQKVIEWINYNFPREQDRLSLMLNSYRLCRFLLLSKANDFKKERLDLNKKELLTALDMVSKLHDKTAESGGLQDRWSGVAFFHRIAQWQFPLQQNRYKLLGRTDLLFRKIPQQISPKISYNLEQKMMDATELTPFEFMATGWALGIKSNGILKYKFGVQVNSLKNIITSKSIEKFINSSSGTYSEYKQWVRGINHWKTPRPFLDVYNIDPLEQMPILSVENSINIEADYVVPSPFHIWKRASSGIFYILNDFEKHKEQKGNPFRDAFGEIYKEYVKTQLSQSNTNIKLVDVDSIQYSGKKPDLLLISGRYAILFEVKLGLVDMSSRQLADENSLRTNIKRQFKKATEQLNVFESAIQNREVSHSDLNSVKYITKVIISFEDLFTANASILPLAESELKTDLSNYQIATLQDIECMGTLLSVGHDIVSPLITKNDDSEYRKWQISVFLSEKFHDQTIPPQNPILDNAMTEFYQELTGNTYKRQGNNF